jgi:hypothetical protein
MVLAEIAVVDTYDLERTLHGFNENATGIDDGRISEFCEKPTTSKDERVSDCR